MIRAYLKERRWFRGKARGLISAVIEETFPVLVDTTAAAPEQVTLCILLCTYEDGGSDRYVLPVATAKGAEAEQLRREQPHLVIGELTAPLLHALGRAGALAAADGPEILYDALGSERLLGGLLRQFEGTGRRAAASFTSAAGEPLAAAGDTLVFRPLPDLDLKAARNVTPKPTRTEQTNTSIVFGDAFILKVVRKLDEGASVELEMGEFLTRHGYAKSPQVVGAIEIERSGAAPSPPGAKAKESPTVGILHRFVANQGDAWTFTLKDLAASRSPAHYVPHAALLGTRVGGLHVVLAGGASEPSFAVEPLGREARAALAAAAKSEARALASWLRAGDEARIEACAAAFVDLAEPPVAMRIHGDLHLGQILATGEDFVLIDFEGEPARSLAERKAKRSPLADVAGMLRSFDYAAATALREGASGAGAGAAAAAWSASEARAWWLAVKEAFLGAYREAIRPCAALQMKDEAFRTTLDFYLLEKSLYELSYEANNRPDWITIPRDGLRDLLDSLSAP